MRLLATRSFRVGTGWRLRLASCVAVRSDGTSGTHTRRKGSDDCNHGIAAEHHLVVARQNVGTCQSDVLHGFSGYTGAVEEELAAARR